MVLTFFESLLTLQWGINKINKFKLIWIGQVLVCLYFLRFSVVIYFMSHNFNLSSICILDDLGFLMCGSSLHQTDKITGIIKLSRLFDFILIFWSETTRVKILREMETNYKKDYRKKSKVWNPRVLSEWYLPTFMQWMLLM